MHVRGKAALRHNPRAVDMAIGDRAQGYWPSAGAISPACRS